MAITVPTDGSVISASTFGKPVADQLNLAPKGFIASKTFSVPFTSTANAWTTIPSSDITYTADPLRRYRIDVSMMLKQATSASNGFIGLFISGGVQLSGSAAYIVQGGNSNASFFHLEPAISGVRTLVL